MTTTIDQLIDLLYQAKERTGNNLLTQEVVFQFSGEAHTHEITGIYVFDGQLRIWSGEAPR